jgi:hypothetical protein
MAAIFVRNTGREMANRITMEFILIGDDFREAGNFPRPPSVELLQ